MQAIVTWSEKYINNMAASCSNVDDPNAILALLGIPVGLNHAIPTTAANGDTIAQTGVLSMNVVDPSDALTGFSTKFCNNPLSQGQGADATFLCEILIHRKNGDAFHYGNGDGSVAWTDRSCNSGDVLVGIKGNYDNPYGHITDLIGECQTP